MRWICDKDENHTADGAMGGTWRFEVEDWDGYAIRMIITLRMGDGNVRVGAFGGL